MRYKNDLANLREGAPEGTPTLNTLALSGKFTVLSQLLEDFNRDQNKLLLFSQTKKVLNVIELMLAQKQIPFLRLDGDVDVKQRMGIIQSFNGLQNTHTPGGLCVFLLTTRVGSLGINLTAANKVIIFEPAWNPMVDLQATERAVRIG